MTIIIVAVISALIVGIDQLVKSKSKAVGKDKGDLCAQGIQQDKIQMLHPGILAFNLHG